MSYIDDAKKLRAMMETAHSHGVHENDAHFIIDPLTRQIKYDGGEMPGIVQYDHGSQVLTFEMPRYIDGHDMSLCNKVRVHYINIDASTKEQRPGLYDVTDLRVAAGNESTVLCSWLIYRNATQLVGILAFSLRLACMENGEEVYGLGTERYDKLIVSGGVHNDDVIVEEYADILDQWESRIEALERGGTGSSEPDLVIGLNVANTKMRDKNNLSWNFEDATVEDISVVGGSVLAAMENLEQGLPVRVVLKAMHFYGDSWWYNTIGTAVSVSLKHKENRVDYPNTKCIGLSCGFIAGDVPGEDFSNLYMIYVDLNGETGNVDACIVKMIGYA